MHIGFIRWLNWMTRCIMISSVVLKRHRSVIKSISLQHTHDNHCWTDTYNHRLCIESSLHLPFCNNILLAHPFKPSHLVRRPSSRTFLAQTCSWGFAATTRRSKDLRGNEDQPSLLTRTGKPDAGIGNFTPPLVTGFRDVRVRRGISVVHGVAINMCLRGSPTTILP